MMNKLLISSILTVLLAGCGSESTGVGANILNPRTPPAVQSRAESVIQSNTNMTYTTYQNSGASLEVREQMKGMRISILGTTSLMVTATTVEKVDKTCKTGIYQSSMSATQFKNMNAWNNISGLGRFQCLDTECNYLLLMIEQTRVVWNTSNGIGQRTTSSVPVVFVQADGVYSPTDSSEQGSVLSSYFLITNSQEKGALVCNDEVKAKALNPVGTVTNGTTSSGTGVSNNSWF